jgi:leucyl-tRNA synthetase
MVLAKTYYYLDSNSKKIWVNPAEVELKNLDSSNIEEVVAIHKSSGQRLISGELEKMSKSKNNGVDPQQIIAKYGADTARLFMLFAAPPLQSLEWSDAGIEGSHRFLRKLWKLVYEHQKTGVCEKYAHGELTVLEKKLRTELHQTIIKVTHDIKDRQQFNTAIASIMELLNSYNKLDLTSGNGKKLAQEILETVTIMLSPIVPHITEEIWSVLRPNTELLAMQWPTADSLALAVDEVELIIQINGKLRGKIMITKSLSKDEVIHLAKENPNVAKFIAGNEIKKIIVVPEKLVNIVI